jgi:superfamily II DNA/RNA helicase
MIFADLGLSEELIQAVTDSGYTTPTAIQAQAIPSVLMGKDIIGIAQTGTGKTAAFVLPMIDVLGEGRSRARMPRSLILEPTRELAAQVAENFDKYGKYHKLSMALLIGGVSMGDQIKALEKGVDVLIATPGRLMDLYDRGNILLTGCGLLVIDEADRMLDMGFIPDIETICTRLPATRQTLLFSATMPPPIKKLSDRFLTSPKYIEVARPASANASIEQGKVRVQSRRKRDTLFAMLDAGVHTAIIFCNRKTTVRDLNKALRQGGFDSGEIHGDMEQRDRIAELDKFKDGTINILVASDVAARGLDIKGVSHVFNYDAPWHPDDYVHRIGRTGRAGATGKAYTFITEEDAEALANIEKLIGTTIPEITVADPGAASVEAKPAKAREPEERAPRRRTRSGEAKARAPREEPAPREERKVEEEVREEKPRREPRAAKSSESKPREERPRAAERRPAAASKPRRSHERDDGPDDGWNGPMPDFLSVGFGES